MPRIWAIADPHLSFAQPKPMDIFGEHWRDHPARIAKNCRAVVADDDLLLLPGDLSWALKRPDAEPDLAWLAALPGVKVLCKGNHDYWWDSDKPLNAPGLHDTPFVSADGRIGVVGTRGWYPPTTQMTPEERGQCQKIIAREAMRLARRLEAVQACPDKIAMIHYPPLVEFAPVLKRFRVRTVLYGHLHLNGQEHPLPEEWQAMRARCVAADRLRFAPRLVASF